MTPVGVCEGALEASVLLGAIRRLSAASVAERASEHDDGVGEGEAKRRRGRIPLGLCRNAGPPYFGACTCTGTLLRRPVTFSRIQSNTYRCSPAHIITQDITGNAHLSTNGTGPWQLRPTCVASVIHALQWLSSPIELLLASSPLKSHGLHDLHTCRALAKDRADVRLRTNKHEATGLQRLATSRGAITTSSGPLMDWNALGLPSSSIWLSVPG